MRTRRNWQFLHFSFFSSAIPLNNKMNKCFIIPFLFRLMIATVVQFLLYTDWENEYIQQQKKSSLEFISNFESFFSFRSAMSQLLTHKNAPKLFLFKRIVLNFLRTSVWLSNLQCWKIQWNLKENQKSKNLNGTTIPSRQFPLIENSSLKWIYLCVLSFN